jgi:hypothetical protein
MSRKSTKTFGELRIACKEADLVFLSDTPDEENIFKSTDKTFWSFKCRCGKQFQNSPSRIIEKHVTSCGCGNRKEKNNAKNAKYTFGDIRKLCNEKNLILLSSEPDYKKIYKTNQQWPFICFCGKKFTTRLTSFYAKSISSCGCLKTLRLKKARQSKKNNYKFKDIIEACNKNNLIFLENVELTELIYNTTSGNWPIQCFCGNTFYPRLHYLIRGFTSSCGCIQSKPQIDLFNLIKSWGIEVKWNDRIQIKPKELDIFCINNKIGIEYCGLKWHGEKWLTNTEENARLYHKHKLDLCKEKGIRLITIFGDEWLEKPLIVINYLKSIFNLKKNTIGARECKVKEINKSMSIDFNNQFHIQGSPYFSDGVFLGLFYENELIGTASYINIKEKDWYLSRYCVKGDLSIPGGLSKLQKQFIVNQQPKSIVSFSDNRWSEGKIYKTLGFKIEKKIEPSYFYFKNGRDGPRHHKVFGRKSHIAKMAPEIFDPNKTEWEMMQELGYDRIWDCGKIRWHLDTP